MWKHILNDRLWFWGFKKKKKKNQNPIYKCKEFCKKFFYFFKCKLGLKWCIKEWSYSTFSRCQSSAALTSLKWSEETWRTDDKNHNEVTHLTFFCCTEITKLLLINRSLWLLDANNCQQANVSIATGDNVT